MAQTKERQASALTLAAHKGDADALILRALGHRSPGNPTGSLPAQLPQGLPARLPDHIGGKNEMTMNTRFSESRTGESQPSATRTQGPRTRKARADFRVLPANWGGPRAPRQPGPIVREQGPFPEALDSPRRAAAPPLGVPLCIEEAAELIGCSPWTVRQTLIPRGLPHFRFRANGRLVFYRDQIIRWIENQQQGGKTTS
jgi:hypothetical protein